MTQTNGHASPVAGQVVNDAPRPAPAELSRTLYWEIKTADGMTESWLVLQEEIAAQLSDEELIAECHRRGYHVEELIPAKDLGLNDPPRVIPELFEALARDTERPPPTETEQVRQHGIGLPNLGWKPIARKPRPYVGVFLWFPQLAGSCPVMCGHWTGKRFSACGLDPESQEQPSHWATMPGGPEDQAPPTETDNARPDGCPHEYAQRGFVQVCKLCNDTKRPDVTVGFVELYDGGGVKGRLPSEWLRDRADEYRMGKREGDALPSDFWRAMFDWLDGDGPERGRAP